MRKLTKSHISRETASGTPISAGAFRPNRLMAYEARNMSTPNKTIFILSGAR